MRNLIWVFLLLFMSDIGIAQYVERNEPNLAGRVSYMPKNNLYLEDKMYQGNMSEWDFNNIISNVQSSMGGISQMTGRQLVINGEWTNSEVNAYATLQGNTRLVVIYGGLARRQEVTPDGLAMVICHEVGHHLGGFPFVESWASNEGNSDYYTTLSCARVLWGNQPEENAQSALYIPQYPKSLCDRAWGTENERNLCYRTMLAGKSLGDLLATLGNGYVQFETPDRTVVRQTVHTHPQAQCRLDTYMSGSLCNSRWNHGKIPRTESEIYQSSCKEIPYSMGARPRCWFAPRMNIHY